MTTTNRLTADMRETIGRRIEDMIGWPFVSAPINHRDPSVIYRAALAAIGCIDADMRASEVDEVRQMVDDTLVVATTAKTATQ